MFTFDGDTLRIIFQGVGTFDAQVDLYSDWKEWQLTSDNAKYPPAFETTGGDPVGGGQFIAPYFFLRNDLGWKIKPPPGLSGEIVLLGNLFPRDASRPTFDLTAGGSDILIRQVVSPQALVDGSQTTALELLTKFLRNKVITDPATGVQTVFDDDGTTPLAQGQLYEDAAGTQTYRGQGAERRERLV